MLIIYFVHADHLTLQYFFSICSGITVQLSDYELCSSKLRVEVVQVCFCAFLCRYSTLQFAFGTMASSSVSSAARNPAVFADMLKKNYLTAYSSFFTQLHFHDIATFVNTTTWNSLSGDAGIDDFFEKNR